MTRKTPRSFVNVQSLEILIHKATFYGVLFLSTLSEEKSFILSPVNFFQDVFKIREERRGGIVHGEDGFDIFQGIERRALTSSSAQRGGI